MGPSPTWCLGILVSDSGPCQPVIRAGEAESGIKVRLSFQHRGDTEQGLQNAWPVDLLGGLTRSKRPTQSAATAFSKQLLNARQAR